MIRYMLLVCSAMVFGCLDIDIREDNDEYSCEVTGESCEPSVSQPDAAPPPMRDVCSVAGTTNLLTGTCWIEQCIDGEKSLVEKTVGTPCIRKPTSGGSPWVEGVCDGEGACI